MFGLPLPGLSGGLPGLSSSTSSKGEVSGNTLLSGGGDSSVNFSSKPPKWFWPAAIGLALVTIGVVWKLVKKG